jgi:outer membrane protein OmpA-like peptidoglycan-associated protein
MNAKMLIALAGAALATAGCAVEAGKRQPPLGTALTANARLQKAYGDLTERLRDLSIAFRAAADDTVTFDFDSARLTPAARAALDTQAMWLMANEGVRMSVIGHTDLVGPERYNDRLGLRRARAVVRYLVSKGVGRDRLDAIASAGESEPVVPTDTRERRNRRAVTVVAGLDRVYVGPNLDGEYAAQIYNAYQGAE